VSGVAPRPGLGIALLPPIVAADTLYD